MAPYLVRLSDTLGNFRGAWLIPLRQHSISYSYVRTYLTLHPTMGRLGHTKAQLVRGLWRSLLLTLNRVTKQQRPHSSVCGTWRRAASLSTHSRIPSVNLSPKPIRIAALEHSLAPHFHPNALDPPPPLPFRIDRTKSQNIPVYLKWSKNHNVVSTIVLKVRGKREVFRKELQILCGSKVIDHERFFEVRGSHKAKIKRWLSSIGF